MRDNNPEAYGMDCQVGPSTYPAEDADEIMPDHVRERLAAKKAGSKGEVADGKDDTRSAA